MILHRQRYVVPLLLVVVISGWSCCLVPYSNTAFGVVLVAASSMSSSLLDHPPRPRQRQRPRPTFVRGTRHEGRTQPEESETAATATTASTIPRIASAAAAVSSRSVQETELPMAEEPLALVVSAGKTKKRRRKDDKEKKEESTKKVSSVSVVTEAPSSSTSVPSMFPSVATTTASSPSLPITTTAVPSASPLETTTTTSPSSNSSRRNVELLPFSVVVDGAFQDEKDYIRDELQYYLLEYYQKQNAELLSRLESVTLENVSHTVLPNEDTTTQEAMVSRLGYTGHAGISIASPGRSPPDEDEDEDYVEGLDETARRTDAVVHAVQIAALEDTVALQQHFLQFFTLARLGALDQEPVVVMSVQIDDRAPHFLHFTNTWETIEEILLDDEEEDPTLSSTTAASMNTEDPNTSSNSRSLYLGIGTVVLILLTGGVFVFAWRYKKQRQRSYYRGQRLKGGGERDFDHHNTNTNTNEGSARMRDIVDDVDQYDATQDEPSEMEAALYHTAIERSDSTTHGRKKLSPFTYLYDKSKRLVGGGATQPETTSATTLTTIHLQYHPQPRNSGRHTPDTNTTHTATHQDTTTAVSLHENEDEDSMMGYSLVSREKENGSTNGVGVRDTNNNKTINTGDDDLTHDVVDDDDDDDDKEESKDTVARQCYSGNVAVEDGIAIGADDVSVVSSELSYRTNPMIPQHTNPDTDGGNNPSSQLHQQQQLVLHDTIFAVASSPQNHRYPSLLGGADDDVSDAPSDEQYTHPLD